MRPCRINNTKTHVFVWAKVQAITILPPPHSSNRYRSTIYASRDAFCRAGARMGRFLYSRNISVIHRAERENAFRAMFCVCRAGHSALKSAAWHAVRGIKNLFNLSFGRIGTGRLHTQVFSE